MHYTERSLSNSEKGFTLIELLVVIAILAVLSVTVVLVLNPAELLAQGRDSTRISDLSTIKTALSLYMSDVINFNLASTFGYTACYLSTTFGNGTTTAKCGVFVGAGITTNASTSAATYRNTDSTGWIPVNFKQLSYGTPFSVLPVDPVNNSRYYYAYAASATGVFEIDAFMESKKYNATGAGNIVTTDGGDNNAVYENGSSLTL